MRAPCTLRGFALALSLGLIGNLPVALADVLHAPPPAGAGTAPEASALTEAIPEGGESFALPTADEPDPLFDEDWGDEEDFESPTVPDPLEPTNRTIYGFNQTVDRFAWRPITRVYRFVVPDMARRSIRRVFFNVNTPIYVMNNLLQARFRDAAETLGAFVVNSTIGWGGLFDAGKELGLHGRPSDFGQTMARYGVGTGPYLMVPFIGPTTVRDGLGFVVDRAFQPLTYFLPIPTQLMWGGGVGIARRDAIHDELEALEASALDPYAVLRSAYAQSRQRSVDEAIRRSEGVRDDASNVASLEF